MTMTKGPDIKQINLTENFLKSYFTKPVELSSLTDKLKKEYYLFLDGKMSTGNFIKSLINFGKSEGYEVKKSKAKR